MYVRRHGALIRVQAPAKLNLFLEVLGRRADGFHELETLMVPIHVFDTLTLCLDSDNRISVDCRWATAADVASSEGQNCSNLPREQDNLVFRALDCLSRAAGVGEGAKVRLTKRIPAAAGLGGGSSDAAAALLAGNALWGLGWSVHRLAKLAAALGSDVPFFLEGGSALCRGRGERIEKLGSLPALHVVVVRPPVGLSTADVYRQCQPARQPRHAGGLVSAIRRGRWSEVPKCMFNRLQEAAERLTPWIRRLRDAFEREGCVAHQMSGSGTSYFGICRHARHARRVAQRLRASGLGSVFSTTTFQQ